MIVYSGVHSNIDLIKVEKKTEGFSKLIMQMGLIFHDKNKKGVQKNKCTRLQKNQTEQLKAPVVLIGS